MTVIEIRHITFKHGNIPILFVNNIPEYFFLKFSTLSQVKYSYKTKYNSCRYYNLFYRYFYEVLDFNLTSILSDKNQFDIIIDNLHGYTQWLHLNIKSIQNYNIALSSLKEFLNWYGYAYKIHVEFKSKFEFILNNQKIQIKNPATYKSLTSNNIKEILRVISPNGIDNPFKHANRLRNYLLIVILVETGIRLGELLLLKIGDFIRNDNQFYLRINYSDTSKNDTRKNKPSYKNQYSQRVIGISTTCYTLFEDYIKYSRYKSNLNDFLLKSNQRKPLSISSVINIIKVVSRISKIEFSCHTLRHHFAESMLKFLIEECDIDIERAKDELRVICGWSLNSNMPSYYTKKYLSDLANLANNKRLLYYYE